MSETRKRIIKIAGWAAVAACLTMIFLLSAESASASAHRSHGIVRAVAEFIAGLFQKETAAEKAALIKTLDFLIRKIAHFSEFGLLGVLSSFTLLLYRFSVKIRLLLASSICLAAAVGDEIHQIFVPGRSCEIRDMLIDFSGGLCGILLVALAVFLVLRRRRKKAVKKAKK